MHHGTQTSVGTPVNSNKKLLTHARCDHIDPANSNCRHGACQRLFADFNQGVSLSAFALHVRNPDTSYVDPHCAHASLPITSWRRRRLVPPTVFLAVCHLRSSPSPLPRRITLAPTCVCARRLPASELRPTLPMQHDDATRSNLSGTDHTIVSSL